MTRRDSPAGHTKGDRDALSEREQEVLAWMVQGMDNQGIAKLMDISLDTVRCHNQHIFEKLGVAHRGEAMAFVLKHDLLDL